MYRRYALLLVLITVIARSYAASNLTCYNIDQVEDENTFPCYPDESSPCCSFGNKCLSNGLCQPSEGQNKGPTKYYTSTCTDDLWETNNCLKICDKNISNPDASDASDAVQSCDNGDYCCYIAGQNDCCATPSLVFHLGAATIQTVLTATSITGALPTATPTISASITALRSSSSLASAGITVSTSGTNSTPTSAPNSNPDNRIAIGAGVGVGVAAGIAILGAFLFLLRRRRGKTTTAKAGEGHAIPAYVDGKGEMDAAHERQIAQELEGSIEKGPQELRTGNNAHEMRADHNAQELRTGFNTHEMGTQAYS